MKQQRKHNLKWRRERGWQKEWAEVEVKGEKKIKIITTTTTCLHNNNAHFLCVFQAFHSLWMNGMFRELSLTHIVGILPVGMYYCPSFCCIFILRPAHFMALTILSAEAKTVAIIVTPPSSTSHPNLIAIEVEYARFTHPQPYTQFTSHTHICNQNTLFSIIPLLWWWPLCFVLLSHYHQVHNWP